MRQFWLVRSATGFFVVFLESFFWNAFPVILFIDFVCVIAIYCQVTGAQKNGVLLLAGACVGREFFSAMPLGISTLSIFFALIISDLLYTYVFTHRQILSLALFVGLVVFVWFVAHHVLVALLTSAHFFTLVSPFPHVGLRMIATYSVTMLLLVVWFRREMFIQTGWITKKI